MSDFQKIIQMIFQKIKTYFTRSRLLRLFNACLFPLMLFYYEVLFHIATQGTPSRIFWVYAFFTALMFGSLLSLVPMLITRPKIRVPVTVVMLVLMAVPFLVEYFVYLQFKVFYDINTITAGAGDVAGQFMGDVFNLVFGRRGIPMLILYFFPIVIYAYAALHAKVVYHGRVQPAFILLFVCILSLGGFNLTLNQDSIGSRMYQSEYSFQNAVGRFGLISSLKLDIQYTVNGKDVSFEITTVETEDDEEDSTVSEEIDTGSDADETAEEDISDEVIEDAETEEEEVVEYDLNILDIDFTALASSTDDDTLSQLDTYVASLSASSQNEYTGLFEGKNLIFITAEAFSGDIIDEELTPTLYRLATQGINFTDYYVPSSAGTTGGEYENIFGLLPMEGGDSFKITTDFTNSMTIFSQLSLLGYNGWGFHNNSYTYYSRNETHNNIGLSNGFMGYGNGMEEYVTDQWPQSDLEMIEGTVDLYIDQEPFCIYYMTVSGHSPYNLETGNAISRQNADRVADLDYSDTVKAYIAAQLELEDALTYLVDALEEAGIADDTVIVLSADHFPYGLDDDSTLGSTPYLNELYGYEVTTYLERDHNTLIIWSGCLEDDDPIVVDSPTSSLDILPTLMNLFGIDFDSRLFVGRDVFSDADALVFDTYYDWKTDLGTYDAATDTFTPADDTVEVSDEYIESIKQIVRNKITYCSGLLEVDYFAHVFGDD